MQVIVQLQSDGSRLIDGCTRQVRDVPAEKRIIGGLDRKFVGLNYPQTESRPIGLGSTQNANL